MRSCASHYGLRLLAVSSVCCLTLFAGGCTAKVSSSTTSVSGSFAELDDAELAKKADVIVEGTVVAQPQAQKGRAVSAEARQKMLAKGLSEEEIAQMADVEAEAVYTLVLVRPSEVMKGDAGTGNLTVRVLGGKVDGSNVVTDDFPTFTKGETVLLFLGREFDGDLGPLAVYRVDGSKAASHDMGNNRVTDVPSLKRTIAENVGK